MEFRALRRHGDKGFLIWFPLYFLFLYFLFFFIPTCFTCLFIFAVLYMQFRAMGLARPVLELLNREA